MPHNTPLLAVNQLKVSFETQGKTLTAVDEISFKVGHNQFVGIVGESGSGKSVSALSLLDLIAQNGKIESGEIWFQDQELTRAPKSVWHAHRGQKMGLIFQNPLASLNPVFTIGNHFVETLQIHRNVTKAAAWDIAIDLLKKVQLTDPEKRMNQYPHHLSLGMCQRVMIALTLAMMPKLLIADEPTASLDVTIQAQILQLMESLKQEHDMSILMISHDLGVVAQHCDYVYIMYLGKIVEEGPVDKIFLEPKHPYTQALIASIPDPNPNNKKSTPSLKGEIPSPFAIPKGCRFHPRCPISTPHCETANPPLEAKGSQTVACFEV